MRTDETRCTATVWLLYDVHIDPVHETSSLVLGENTPTHLAGLYWKPKDALQCLHNAIRVVNAMMAVGIDYNIQPTEITKPHPIGLLLLCLHLFRVLPGYAITDQIELSGRLSLC
ncbi:unnamed protein product [Protopolystoma xenopodis]|uniref:Calponin-homology (CH) domain-containing protein n=1 Tax=Protopolystoma xenopodis TaxID=117903 RepID=A0A3S5AF67_9PLAT|nr:unnamed protein product [Protopolystoma xenopodis]